MIDYTEMEQRAYDRMNYEELKDRVQRLELRVLALEGKLMKLLLSSSQGSNDKEE